MRYASIAILSIQARPEATAQAPNAALLVLCAAFGVITGGPGICMHLRTRLEGCASWSGKLSSLDGSTRRSSRAMT